MSQHSEENFMAGSDSFWEPGNYKRTTKRIEDGNKLCNELMSLAAERADIEKEYAKKLKGWAAKWNNTIEKGKQTAENQLNKIILGINCAMNSWLWLPKELILKKNMRKN